MGETKRVDWIDYAKGLGILLVVIGHLHRSLMGNSIAKNPLFVTIDNLIYSFHMPLFFYLSGIFADKMASASPNKFWTSRLKTVVYPYFLWSIVQSSFQVVFSQYTTSKLSWSELLKIGYYPVMQFWFLYALFFITVSFFYTKLLIKNSLHLAILFWVLYSLKFFGSSDWPLPLAYICEYAGFYATGAYSFRYLSWFSGLELKKIIFPLFISGSLFGFALFSGLPPILAAIFGSLTVMMLSKVICEFSWFRWIEICGQLSLPIFLTHTLFMAPCRILLQKFLHINDVSVHIIVGLGFGVLVPYGLVKIANRFKIKHVFQW